MTMASFGLPADLSTASLLLFLLEMGDGVALSAMEFGRDERAEVFHRQNSIECGRNLTVDTYLPQSCSRIALKEECVRAALRALRTHVGESRPRHKLPRLDCSLRDWGKRMVLSHGSQHALHLVCKFCDRRALSTENLVWQVELFAVCIHPILEIASYLSSA
jgi:hypothetical protein